MPSFIYPVVLSSGFVVRNGVVGGSTIADTTALEIPCAVLQANLFGINTNAVMQVTSTGPFTIQTTGTLNAGAPVVLGSITQVNGYADGGVTNSVYDSFYIGVYANAGVSAANAASTYTWTFQDTSVNNYGNCTATFQIPTMTVQGVSGVIGSGSNASTILYETNTIQNIFGANTQTYECVVLGNSVVYNILGCLPNQTIEFIAYNYGSVESILYPVSNATGVANFTYTAAPPAGTDGNAWIMYAAGLYTTSDNASTVVTFTSVPSFPIIFNQTTIVANTNLFSGRAFTSNGVLSNVSLYVNNSLIGNTVTNAAGYWTYVPSGLSSGSYYAITAEAIPQQAPYGNVFTWAYSNAITTLGNAVVSEPEFLSVYFGGGPHFTYANTNGNDDYISTWTAVFSGFAANASIQITSSEYTNQEDFYGVSTSYQAPNTVVSVQHIFNDYYSNAANFSAQLAWTFTDLNNVGSNVAVATFALPLATITGNTIFQSYNINDLNDYRVYNYCNYLQLGNSCTATVIGLQPYSNVSFSGGFANGTFRNMTFTALGTVTADANGAVNYTFSVGQNSNAYYLAVTSNVTAFTYGGIIFDQNQIISANSSLIQGYAWTPYDYQSSNTAILANVSIYANAVLLGNTTTNVYGAWSYPVPNTMSSGTYVITAQSVPQNPSAILTAASIPYSNASAQVVIAPSIPVLPNVAITYPSNGAILYTPTISGTASVVGTVHLYNNGSLIANASSGNYTWSATPSLPYGSYVITAEVANANGIAYANVSFDYISPISNIRLLWDTGPSTVDNVSSQSIIVGTATVGYPLQVYNSQGIFVSNIALDGVGNFEYDGDYEPGYVTLTFQQQIGNAVYSTPFSFLWTAPYSNNNLLDQFLSLLPTGPAWPKFIGSTMRAVLKPFFRILMRNGGRAADLLLETFPATPRETLPTWEATLGLTPTSGETDAARQAQVLAKFLATGGQSIPYFKSVANALGDNITINEFSSFKSSINKSTQVDYPYSANFTWQVVANGAVANSTNLANTINALSPAHTIVLYEYE